MDKAMILIWLLLSATFSMLLPTAAMGQAESKAGLVVVHDDENGERVTVTRCVSFIEEQITGLQLLERSGLELYYEPDAFGATVCRIDNSGCGPEASTCFCECQDIPCIYWSYWHLEPDGWTYSQFGADHASSVVGQGDVDAWVWSEGVPNQQAESQPPNVTIEEICGTSEVGATATPTGTPTVTPTVVPTTIVPSPPPSSDPVTIPEPFTILLYASGLAGMGLRAWRNRQRGE